MMSPGQALMLMFLVPAGRPHGIPSNSVRQREGVRVVDITGEEVRERRGESRVYSTTRRLSI
jgi:hypothetical protein